MVNWEQEKEAVAAPAMTDCFRPVGAGKMTFDSEEWRSWTSIAIKGKSCEFETKKEWSWMCDQPAKPGTTTEWYNMSMSTLHEGRQASGLPKKRCRTEGRRFWKAERPLRKTRFWHMTIKQPFWKEKTPTSKELEMHGSEHQTNIVKSKKLTSELSSINDKVPHREGVVKKEQEFFDKESKAESDWTFSKSSWVKKNLVLGDLLEEQNEVNVRMCSQCLCDANR